jgi:hypothetical protein
MATVRKKLDGKLNPQRRLTHTSVRARITGVGFLDFGRGQSGVAPNGFELHPILKVEFLGID